MVPTGSCVWILGLQLVELFWTFRTLGKWGPSWRSCIPQSWGLEVLVWPHVLPLSASWFTQMWARNLVSLLPWPWEASTAMLDCALKLGAKINIFFFPPELILGGYLAISTREVTNTHLFCGSLSCIIRPDTHTQCWVNICHYYCMSGSFNNQRKQQLDSLIHYSKISLEWLHWQST